MSTPVPAPRTPWIPFTPTEVASLLSSATVRWWISGGAALDHTVGRLIRPRPNTDVSVVGEDLANLVTSLPPGLSAWVNGEGNDQVAAFGWAGESDTVLLHDDTRGAWVLQVHIEDGGEDLHDGIRVDRRE